MKRTLTLSSTYVWLLCCLAGCAPEAGSPIFTDATGRHFTPLKVGSNRAVAIFFVLADCPISNSYAPEMNRIAADYAKRGVGFYVVHADRDLPDTELEKHAKEYGYTCPVLVDRNHQLIDQIGIKAAPEVAVIDKTGTTVYMGRIDDRYVAFGRERLQAATPDLRNALDELLRGEKISNPRTRVIGCSITK